MMSFNQLMANEIEPISVDFTVSGLTLDSRVTQKGSVFFALKGEVSDGINYAKQAINNGAYAVLVEGTSLSVDLSVPSFAVENLSEKLGEFAHRFYSYLDEKLNITGVTGTNGKSSIAYGAMNISDNYLGKSAVIGTIGFGTKTDLQDNPYTTPDAISTHKIIQKMANNGVKYIYLEASSHGLEQGRLNAVPIKTAVYTNLSHEHLDYHGDLTSYFEAKRRLFLMPSVKNAVINVNDSYGKQLSGELADKLRVVNYGVNITHSGEFLSAQDIVITPKGYQFILKSSWGETALRVNLFGIFNVENVLAMLAIYLINKGDFTKLPDIVSGIKALKGRMECFGHSQSPLVVVDFAHTPDALSKALEALRSHMQNGDLYCVFGCGGNRDKAKRPMMAKVAEERADFVIITNDNPRYENPDEIIQHIIDGFLNKSSVTIIPDRAQAIATVIKNANADDVILVAGKGHETGQIIGQTIIPFSDQTEVEKALC